MQETTVNERISALVKYYNAGNKSAFAKAVGISNQSLGEILGGRRSAPSFAALQKLFTAFPEVSMEWVFFGKGPMLQGGFNTREPFSLESNQSFNDLIGKEWNMNVRDELKEKIVDIILELASNGSFRGLLMMELDRIKLHEIEERIIKRNTISDGSTTENDPALLALSNFDDIYEEAQLDDERRRVLLEKFAALKTDGAEEYRKLKKRVDEQIAFAAKTKRDNPANSY